jgi:proteasome lid subunit RPN8/RPN11
MFASMECTQAAEALLLHAARVAAPREIVAVLGGCIAGANAQVRQVVMLPNDAIDGAASFAVDSVAFSQCEHELRNGGDTFLGFAHSHPNGSTAPSIRDREQLWTECVQMITDGHTWKAFVLDKNRAVHPLTALPAPTTHAQPTNHQEQRS